MIVEGTFTFDGPRALLWDLLQDPEVMAKALPGARRLVRVEADRFEGEMHVGVGPVSAAAFSVSVTLSDKQPPERFTMQVEGKGGIGFTRGNARVELAEADGGTVMSYRAELKVGGKIAGVGQRLLDSVSKAMTKQGLEAMNRELQRRLAPTAAAPMAIAEQARHLPVIVGAVIVVLAVLLVLVWM